MSRVHVVAGIIFSDDGKEVLISKRPDHLHKGGFWEFPGGKVEAQESEVQALQRELKEELGLEFSSAKPFYQLNFDYPDKQVFLSFWSVYNVLSADDIEGLEGQEWRWVAISHLKDYSFPEANKEIVSRLLSEHTAT